MPTGQQTSPNIEVIIIDDDSSDEQCDDNVAVKSEHGSEHEEESKIRNHSSEGQEKNNVENEQPEKPSISQVLDRTNVTIRRKRGIPDEEETAEGDTVLDEILLELNNPPKRPARNILKPTRIRNSYTFDTP